MISAQVKANSYTVPNTPRVIPRWSAPKRNLIKVNTNAGMNPNKNLVGLEIILRDHSSSVLAASVKKLATGYSVSIAEAVAVLKGLQLALDLDLLPAIVETDSLDVATAINNPSVYLFEVGLVISDIVDVLGRCPGSKNSYSDCISKALEVDNERIV
ncbi:hypothetical protein ACOSQ2_022434 [Xanthoceras sorbifolium]